MNLVDTHLHLCNIIDRGVPLKQIIEKALSIGVCGMVNISTNIDEVCQSNLFKEECNKYKRLKLWHAAAHTPSMVAQDSAVESMVELMKRLGPSMFDAIGETGLDVRFFDGDGYKKQVDAFRLFLGLAKRWGKPAIVHCYDAFKEVISVIDEEEMVTPYGSGVCHCFSGGQEDLFAFIDRGWFISISGMITFKNAHKLRAAIKSMPIDFLVVETDSPYLSPEPYRGKTNQPAYIIETIRVLSSVFNLDIDQLQEILYINSQKLLGFSQQI